MASSSGSIMNWLGKTSTLSKSENSDSRLQVTETETIADERVGKRNREETSPVNKKTKGGDWDEDDEFIGLLRSLVIEMKQVREEMVTKTDFKVELSNIYSEIKSINNVIQAQNAEIMHLKTEIASMSLVIENIEKDRRDDMDDLRQKVHEAGEKTASLAMKVDDLENRSRRNNIIIHGTDEDAKETWSGTEEKVKEFLRNNLQIELQGNIQRAHRLGRVRYDQKPRPIMVCLSDWKDKDKIMLSTPKLKNTIFSVSEDFSNGTREARRNLVKYAKERRWLGWKLRYNKLIYQGYTYQYDATTNDVKMIQPLHQQQQQQQGQAERRTATHLQ